MGEANAERGDSLMSQGMKVLDCVDTVLKDIDLRLSRHFIFGCDLHIQSITQR